MKITVKKVAGIVVCAVLVLGIAGCNSNVNTHEHTFATEWTTSETFHWKKAMCDDTDEVKDKAEHSFGEWTIIKEPTEELEGRRVKVCTVCHYIAEEKLAKLEHVHTFATTYTSDAKQHWYAATCGHKYVVSKIAEHLFGEWTITAKPTEKVEGKREKECTVCHYKAEEILAKIGVSKIEIAKPAIKTEYFVGDSLDTTGLEIIATMNNGEREVVTDWISEFDNTVEGDKVVVKVKFGGKETSYNVKVIAVEVVKIEITKNATKKEYCINEPLDVSGLEVTAIMNNKSREVVSGWTIEFDNTVARDSIPVKIRYLGQETYYTVKINSSHIWNENMICNVCKYDYCYSTPIDCSTHKNATSSSTYVYFGVFPRTVLPLDSTVIIDENVNFTMGSNIYFKGSDDEYYAKVLEDAYSSVNEYTDGTQAKKKTSSSYRYFKVEPIKWKVLSADYNKTGKALLFAEEILTANVPYYDYFYEKERRSVEETPIIYSNNYKYSEIRAYLNGLDYYYANKPDKTSKKTDYTDKGFLQTAFTNVAQDKITVTVVDNSAASTADRGNNLSQQVKCVCANTQDKIFLLSEKEVTTGEYGFDWSYHKESNTRIRKPTDYAIANYVKQSSTVGYGSYWWLRSPKDDTSMLYDTALLVRDNGQANYSFDVRGCYYGVVPALTISFQ